MKDDNQLFPYLSNSSMAETQKTPEDPFLNEKVQLNSMKVTPGKEGSRSRCPHRSRFAAFTAGRLHE
jgi:hypothetical protein